MYRYSSDSTKRPSNCQPVLKCALDQQEHTASGSAASLLAPALIRPDVRAGSGLTASHTPAAMVAIGCAVDNNLGADFALPEQHRHLQ